MTIFFIAVLISPAVASLLLSRCLALEPAGFFSLEEGRFGDLYLAFFPRFCNACCCTPALGDRAVPPLSGSDSF